MTYDKGTAVLINGDTPGTILRDNPNGTKALVEIGRDARWIDRSRITSAASHLAYNEQPSPANRVYRGVMDEQLTKRGG